MSMLTADAIDLALGGVPILKEVSACFQAGRITAILGPNGAGKSSLMACLAGLHKPDRGAVLLNGQSRADLTRRELARRIGFLPQSAEIHWDIDAQTLVALGRYPHRGRWGDSPEDGAAIARAMAATDVTRFARRPVKTLSGGERARVLLARVLAGEPDWLLADEPFANLDPAHQLDGLEALRRVARTGAGVVVVLHDLTHAAQLADDIVLMREGRVMAQGAAQTVLDPALIARTFDIAAHIGVTPDGARFIVAGRTAG